MAARWRFETAHERVGAARVCTRVYETLDELAEEVQDGGWEYDSPLQVLDELRERLQKTLPFDPEDTGRRS